MTKFIKIYYILFIYCMCVYVVGVVVHIRVFLTRSVAACGSQFSPYTRDWTLIAGLGGGSLVTAQHLLAQDKDFIQRKLEKHAKSCILIGLYNFLELSNLMVRSWMHFSSNKFYSLFSQKVFLGCKFDWNWNYWVIIEVITFKWKSPR